ncbi:MAG: nucleotidyltransferase domain-containing protein [Vicinamibacterales bacterium]
MLRPGEAHELVCIRTMEALDAAGVPFLVGGTFAFSCYTGEERITKDLDVMIRRSHLPQALEALAGAGFETSQPYPHWLAKATQGDFLVDLIFASGNGVAGVDDAWFEHAGRANLFGHEVLVSPPEEMIWSKAFVMERERYDGADVAHLLWARSQTLDWPRLERRFGDLLPVLYAHVTQFLFIYSDGWQRLPSGVFERLQARSLELLRSQEQKVCRGTLLSREQYLHDVERLGYQDGRRALGVMSGQDVEIWTAAIEHRE